MAKPKVGDVVEVKTRRGLAYAQFTHKHPRYGALLRVFGTFHRSRPDDLRALVSESPSFHCFFPLGAAVARGIVAIAGSVDIPAQAKSFPCFRAGVVDPATGRVAQWWLWDGDREWKAGALSEDQRRLPIRGVWNDTLLIERLEAGWTPESDPS
jgi:hypothetical protein